MDAAFDTLGAARALEAADLPHGQAETIAEVVRQGQGDLATKAAVQVAMKSEIDAVKADVAAVKESIGGLRWMMGVVLAIGLANTAVVALALR